jgi:hypothetical protein
MKSEKIAIADDGATGVSPLCSPESSISRERHFLDVLEDDDVREVLRERRKLPQHPILPNKET